MAVAKQCPELFIQVDYRTWLGEVQKDLQTMHMEMNGWRKNWEYDFRKEYDAHATPHDAAIHAHDFWWQHVLDESWT
ncbi:MAG: hypothetical protein DMG71_20800 [Acidobacteria bacterium]|nr:MAG: hypothetical protein DMG71_20800 [Acidobacteriota bacterium]